MSKRILVIEDNDETRELLRIALEKRGYQVTVAEDGVRGYDTALFLKPDLIVTDIQMPGADGVHVIRRVRNTSSLEKKPMVVRIGALLEGESRSSGTERRGQENKCLFQ